MPLPSPPPAENGVGPAENLLATGSIPQRFSTFLKTAKTTLDRLDYKCKYIAAYICKPSHENSAKNQ
jgi:hypothetical protein